jgi:hypothetical protein
MIDHANLVTLTCHSLVDESLFAKEKLFPFFHDVWQSKKRMHNELNQSMIQNQIRLRLEVKTRPIREEKVNHDHVIHA